MTASAGRDGPAGQHSSDHSSKLTVRDPTFGQLDHQIGSQLLGRTDPSVAVNSLASIAAGQCKPMGFVSLRGASRHPSLPLGRFASFCPVPTLNDCDQPTLIILTGFLQFDEYVDGSSVFGRRI